MNDGHQQGEAGVPPWRLHTAALLLAPALLTFNNERGDMEEKRGHFECPDCGSRKIQVAVWATWSEEHQQLHSNGRPWDRKHDYCEACELVEPFDGSQKTAKWIEWNE